MKAKKIYFIRHFKTVIDPDVPSENWKLSQPNPSVKEKILSNIDQDNIGNLYASAEKKAINTLEFLFEGKAIHVVKELGEVDRSKSGFIPDYNVTVERFFNGNCPEWESVENVASRINTTFKFISEKEKDNMKDVWVVVHGLWFSFILSKLEKKGLMEVWSQLTFGHIYSFDYQYLISAVQDEFGRLT